MIYDRNKMSEETTEERQNNEFAALEAIYGDAVKDNREKIAWKVWRPLDLLLTLNPLHNSDIQGIHCSVMLSFKCCNNYPDKPPTIAIHKMHGLSVENGAKLIAELEAMAIELCGEVMIFQLAQHAQQFLHDHNKPTLSFYEEMLKQKNEMEQEKLRDLQEKENEERQKIKDEIQKRQEILRGAGRQRVHRSSISQENSTEEGHGDTAELVFYAENKSPAKKVVRSQSVEVPCTCNVKTTHVLRVTQRNNKKVYIGNCLGHSLNGSVTYLAIDDDTGQRLVTKKWIIPPATDFQTRTRQLTLFNQDLKVMCRLKHSSLVPYIAVETCKEHVKRTVKQCIYIFREFILGTSLKCLRNKVFMCNDKYEALRMSRHVGLGVLSALKELHSVDVLHRDVRAENVLLDDSGAVKLVGVALDSRMADMVEGESFCDRQTKALDVYAAGQLLYSIVCKEGYYQEVLSDLPSSAKDFFSRCLTEDEHSQWTAEQLVSHGFLVDAPMTLPINKNKEDGGSASEDEDSVKNIQTSPQANGHSRLNAEFEVLTWLGKGAFGDVLKVRNKLDGGFYAIKRVKLNPENVQLNKKITREVKLLSRLNHENVVRYYNAWIESIFDSEDHDVTSSAFVAKSTSKKQDSLECIVAKLGQEVKVEWSISEAPVQQTNASSDSEDDDDDADPWFNMMSPEDESSTDIEFENDSSNQSVTIPSEDVVDAPRPQSERIHQVLYIQMEFCEKNTLRQAIDNGLFKEHFRVWRLFREIVEGLGHVHQRGMIHRDLKPVNIFLDSNDHVKIGDFGLATKAFTALPVDDRNKQEDLSGSLTGQIGTALYVAPELLQATTKVIYNQKVDIYSLGIILFEMFHPLTTGMERMMVLTALRTKEIRMPTEFEKEDNGKQIHVIRWLLNHDASERPTCAELLCSEHVPRAVGEGALSALLQHTLADTGSRGYRRLVAACLDQRATAAEDFTYHNGMKTKPVEVLAAIKDNVTKVFKTHGGIEYSPPLLIPRAKGWDSYPNAVRVMTSSGSVSHLPHDLRLPFARHIAYTGTKYMRRYVADRVYREKHVQGFHPREIYECAFDIVTPRTDSLWADAELLVIASRAATACSLKVHIKLNHIEILRTLLLCCGVSRDRHADMFPVLLDVSLGRITSLQLQTHLTSLCVSNRDVTNLLRLMEEDVSVYELRDLVSKYVKENKSLKAVGGAVSELEAVYRNAVALGCDCPMTVVPFLAYNATQHNAVFWQMSVIRDEQKSTAKHRTGNLIAAGGRYDALVEEFWRVARTEKEHDNTELNVTSVGFSMALERMAAILQKMDGEVPRNSLFESELISVCVWGVAGSGREGLAAVKRASLAKCAWRSGLRCVAWPGTGDNNDARELAAASLLLCAEDNVVRVTCWGGYGVREHKVSYTEVMDFVKQKLHPNSLRSFDGSSNRAINWSETEKTNSNGPIISVTFITASERITKNTKRQIENQISGQVSSILCRLGACCRCRVSALALACEAALVRSLAARLTAPLLAADLAAAFRSLADQYIKRQNILDEALHELTNLVKQNNQNRSTDETQLYVLYSIPDSLCRLVT